MTSIERAHRFPLSTLLPFTSRSLSPYPLQRPPQVYLLKPAFFSSVETPMSAVPPTAGDALIERDPGASLRFFWLASCYPQPLGECFYPEFLLSPSDSWRFFGCTLLRLLQEAERKSRRISARSFPIILCSTADTLHLKVTLSCYFCPLAKCQLPSSSPCLLPSIPHRFPYPSRSYPFPARCVMSNVPRAL